jgi:hypothetical protein
MSLYAATAGADSDRWRLERQYQLGDRQGALALRTLRWLQAEADALSEQITAEVGRQWRAAAVRAGSGAQDGGYATAVPWPPPPGPATPPPGGNADERLRRLSRPEVE